MFHRTAGTKRKSGFTLIELLVVIAIIGILAAVVLASLSDSRSLAEVRKVQADLRNIHTAMEVLFNDTGLYPHQYHRFCPPRNAPNNEVYLDDPEAGLVATDGNFPNWRGPYVSGVVDPWGNPYVFDEDYRCTAGAIGCNGIADSSPDSSVLVSCGPDGATGGGGCVYNDDNIVYLLCRR
jgi:general secretion pathway protein G